jgi:hypothetical protein
MLCWDFKEPIVRKPDFFIVGAPKSGTTAMNKYLEQHPEIFIPRGKEFHFFGSDLKKSKRKYIHDADRYLSLFMKSQNEKRIGEASVMYLYSTMAPIEIKRFNAAAQIIIMLRNPVDMLYSFHSQLLYGGFEDIVDFKGALDAEEDRKQGKRIPQSALLLNALFYRDVAKYSRQVQRYFEVFSRETVHIIIFDDFKRNTGREYSETLRFLGVNLDFQPKFEVINPNKRARSKLVTKLYQRPPKLVRWPVRALIPLGIRRMLEEKTRHFNTKYQRRSDMDANLKESLKEEFAPEIEKLSELLDRDLTHWSRN